MERYSKTIWDREVDSQEVDNGKSRWLRVVGRPRDVANGSARQRLTTNDQRRYQEGKAMNILEMCDSAAASVPVEATAEQAIRAMLDGHVGAVAIVDQEQRVAGIFSERDVLRRLSLSEHDPRKISVREVMTTPVEMATRATSASEALATMVQRHYRHLPIVDDDGRLLGMLSIRNLLQAQVDTLMGQLDQARAVVL